MTITTTSSRASEAELLRLDRIEAQMLQHGGVDADDMEWMAQTCRAALSAVPPQGQGQEGVSVKDIALAENADFDLWWAGSGRRRSYSVLAEQAAHAAWRERASRSCLSDTPKPGVSADDLVEARAKIEHLCGSWNALVGVIEAACDDLSIPYGGFNGAPAHMVQRIAERAAEVTEIRGMLLAGQGDDDGARILPDLGRRMSTPAMVAECIALLEKRRDVIEAPSTSEMDACERAWNEGYDAALAPLPAASTGEE